MTDLTAITTHLTDRRAEQVRVAVGKLQDAVVAGLVPNKLFTDAKDVLNRAVDEATSKFDDANRARYSAWNFPFNVLIMGAHNLPAALKEANHAVAKRYNIKELAEERAAFLSTLMPLHALLQDAKPLIVKRGDARMPVVKSAKQIMREGQAMTCQCCDRGILANMGTIALHGYERPGHGWQTGSCVGAKELPFEVSRDRLGAMIKSWQTQRRDMITARRDVETERKPVVVSVDDRSQQRDRYGRYPQKQLDITRENFDASPVARSYGSFDKLKERELLRRASAITEIGQAIREQQARYNGWKQTHSWNATSKTWEAL